MNFKKNNDTHMKKNKFDVSFNEFFYLLVTNEEFRDVVCNIFNRCEYDYVYLEFPGLNKLNCNKRAEFVLINTEEFYKSDYSAFNEHFINKQQESIILFKNQKKDTDLITVCPSTDENFNNSCSDIMTFMKSNYVLKTIKHQLLINIGIKMLECLQNDQLKYLSTSGRGVNWLHVRICDSPRYYNNHKYV